MVFRYFCYKPVDKPWISKESNYNYDKRIISVYLEKTKEAIKIDNPDT